MKDPTPTLEFYAQIQTNKIKATIHRTPNPDCPACRTKSLHQPDDWQEYHPVAGTGIIDGKFFGRQA